MGMIRNHLQQMKVEQPDEYKKLMKGYKSEDEFVHDALGFSRKAINHHEYTKRSRKR